MSNFWQRLITGIVFLTVLISGILFSQWTFALLFALIDVLALNEFYRISKPLTIYGMAVGLISFALSFLAFANIIEKSALALVVPMLALVFIIVLFGKFENPISTIATTFYGLVYIALPFALVSPIAFHTNELWFLECSS